MVNDASYSPHDQFLVFFLFLKSSCFQIETGIKLKCTQPPFHIFESNERFSLKSRTGRIVLSHQIQSSAATGNMSLNTTHKLSSIHFKITQAPSSPTTVSWKARFSNG